MSDAAAHRSALIALAHPDGGWGYAADQPAWLSWRTPSPQTIRRLTLIRSGLEAQFPTLVSVGAVA